jgi:PRC-barrel domain
LSLLPPLRPPSAGLQLRTLLRDISPETIPIAVYYKENVHDPADQKIGRIVDLVIKPDGAVPAAIVSVGGFLGVASKYVAVPFAALQVRQKERKPYLIWIPTRSW